VLADTVLADTVLADTAPADAVWATAAPAPGSVVIATTATLTPMTVNRPPAILNRPDLRVSLNRPPVFVIMGIVNRVLAAPGRPIPPVLMPSGRAYSASHRRAIV
jgi:hypothetical protein